MLRVVWKGESTPAALLIATVAKASPDPASPENETEFMDPSIEV